MALRSLHRAEKEIKENRQLYIDIMTALVKANRFIYNNKAKTVEIAEIHTAGRRCVARLMIFSLTLAHGR